jgi:hypothetical protein
MRIAVKLMPITMKKQYLPGHSPTHRAVRYGHMIVSTGKNMTVSKAKIKGVSNTARIMRMFFSLAIS